MVDSIAIKIIKERIEYLKSVTPSMFDSNSEYDVFEETNYSKIDMLEDLLDEIDMETKDKEKLCTACNGTGYYDGGISQSPLS